MKTENYDVVVVGSGHAGIEAALAASRLGCSTLLLTQNLDTIGQMSCNPAIGGIAKGTIVREIDALGGFMGRNADATGIQFRLLNRTKGPSVRSPRAQCDKKAYQFRAKAVLESTPNLTIRQATVRRVMTQSGRVAGVETDLDSRISAHSVVITSGTFLRGLLHVGDITKQGGRMADTVSGLSTSLCELGFAVGRFKTGTPCRISGRTIDFGACQVQRGDDPPTLFSFLPLEALSDDSLDIFTLNQLGRSIRQRDCWITHTTAETHRIISENLHRSALYSGRIEGTGPRYCPSIEDKVVKFASRAAHQIFLEPEGLHTDEFYVNGISTSLPYEVQVEFVRTIPGLENCELMRPGYAVEYDYFPPTQLQHTLETKLIRGLYFAGQVNGTSGYEEAAAQGLIAGANAALSAHQLPGLTLSRNSSYIGVLIDDLVTKGTDEPYRMFTSRAEQRLTLRHDNADQRLTERGYQVGLVGQTRWRAYKEKVSALVRTIERTRTIFVAGQRLDALLKRQDFTLELLPPDLRKEIPDELWELIETDLKYAGYVERQNIHNEKLATFSGQPIPSDFDFERVPGLRRETCEKLAKARPIRFSDAASISGITPSDLQVISIFLRNSRLRSSVKPGAQSN